MSALLFLQAPEQNQSTSARVDKKHLPPAASISVNTDGSITSKPREGTQTVAPKSSATDSPVRVTSSDAVDAGLANLIQESSLIDFFRRTQPTQLTTAGTGQIPQFTEIAHAQLLLAARGVILNRNQISVIDDRISSTQTGALSTEEISALKLVLDEKIARSAFRRIKESP